MLLVRSLTNNENNDNKESNNNSNIIDMIKKDMEHLIST